eukprot:CAMPEP_0170622736 /NCGR_PEP_ID=MMETSP0224-20130122/29297_1 /TAXON_ID=285029 /ORGANISM="Togula jolla, Strain CCCM 725" /LENGTH=77 /DNA_ID=CAMNT_0010949089 /DNA_START=44 /DNA_END=274 /DNA_ORIENTATION=+
MARSSVMTLIVVGALALAMGSLALSFVGTPGLRGSSVRNPEVAMHFFGSEPVTTTPPPAAVADLDPNTFILGVTALM